MIESMEPEPIIARVPGLGRGNIVGLNLILTDQKIAGIDIRKITVRGSRVRRHGREIGNVVISVAS